MVITVFGDVHGNLVALEKLFQIEKHNTDLFISHGDIVNYGPWSNECVQFLNAQSNCKALKGNHEQFFIEGNYGGTNLIAKSFFDFCYPNFDDDGLLDLKSYGSSLQIDNFTIQHTLDNSYIFADTSLEKFDINKNYIIGHSHQQFYRNIGDKMLYNTGSIGQNRQYINQSCYLKIDTNNNKVILKSFLHDIDKVINEMKKLNYPKICLEYYLSKEKVII